MLDKDKIYYSITEVSTIMNLKPSVLRFWEKEFKNLKAYRLSKVSKRKYTFKDLQMILKIKIFLYDRHFTIKGAKMQLENAPDIPFEKFNIFLEKPYLYNRELEIRNINPEHNAAISKLSEIKKLLKKIK